MKNNILFLFGLSICRWFHLILPVIVYYWQEKGLGLQDVFLLQAGFSLTVVLFEVPSGMLADRLGYRLSLVFGSVLHLIGMCFLALAENFGGFLLAEILLGLSMGLVSGTDSAMLFETLKTQNKEQEYGRLEGRLSSFNTGSEAVASLLGAWLASYWLTVPFFLQIALSALALILTLLLKEPPRPVQNDDSSKDDTRGNLKGVVSLIRQRPGLGFLILHSGVFSALTLCAVWFIQPFALQQGLPLAWYGLYWALLNATASASSFLSWRFSQRFTKPVLISLPIPLGCLIWLLIAYLKDWYALIVLFGFYILRGIVGVIYRDWVQQMTESHIRATVLSLQSMVTRILFCLIGPLLGFIADHYSMSTAFACSAFIFAITGMISTVLLRRS